jgi:hypothetical protein
MHGFCKTKAVESRLVTRPSLRYWVLRFTRSSKTNRVTALPVVLADSNIIEVPAMVMCVIGGLLIYGTIISFTMFFQEEQEF